MKRRKLLSLALCICMIVCMLPLTSSAAQVGDTIDWVLYTDIVTYINGYYIPSYNINGYTAVVVEDLLYYGFDVNWDGAAKTLKVTRNYARDFCPPDSYKPAKNTHKVGDRAMPVLYTDIVTYFEGDRVTSYNVDGRTIAYVDDLATYYQQSYIWDGTARTLKLTLAENTAAAFEPLTITKQPDNVTVTSDSGTALFTVDVAGGTLPYSYQWQVAKNGSNTFTDIPFANAFLLNYSYSGASSGLSLRCVVSDSSGQVRTSSAAKILYAGTTSGPLSATITASKDSSPLNTSVPIVCSATGGSGTYTYSWYRNGSKISSSGSTYNANESTAGTYYYLCAVSDGKDLVTTSPVSIVFGSEAKTGKIESNAKVGETFNGVFNFKNYGLSDTYASFSCTSNDLYNYGLSLSGTNSSVTISGKPTKAGTGKATYKLTRADGTVDTLNIQITITETVAALKVVTNPADKTLSPDSSGLFAFSISVKISGGVAPYTYQWQVSKDKSSWSNSAKHTSSDTSDTNSNHFGSSSAGMIWYERCIITDSKGNSVTSAAAALTLKEAASTLKIISQPVSQTLSQSSDGKYNFTISVAISGGVAPYTYQWQASSNNSSWSNSAKHSSSSTTDVNTSFFTSSVTGTTWYERCVITDSKGNSVTSSSAKFTFNASLKIVTQPVSQTLEANSEGKFPFTISVAISGGVAPYTYQWQSSSNNSSWSNTAKHSSSSTTDTNSNFFSATSSGSTWYERCIITDSKGNSVTTSSASLYMTKTVTVTFDSMNGAKVGNSFSQDILFSNFGLASSYKSVTCKQINLVDYGISVDSDDSTHIRVFSSKIKKSGTAKATYALTRSDGTVDKLIIYVNISG